MVQADLSRQYLAGAGFTGFVTFDALDPSAISSQQGVYVVLREDDSPPIFLEVSVGGHFKGRDPTVPVEVLQRRWISGATALYIGKATSLRTRLRQFRDFGRGRPVGHWGGRYIWQIAGSGDLLVAWRPAPDPGAEEGRLLRAFEARHSMLPFANIARGQLVADVEAERDETAPAARSLRGIPSSPALTAPELARELGVDPKRLRSWLRNQGWRSPAEHGARWLLDEHQVRAARQHFGHP